MAVHILITGTSRGIGAATAAALRAQGARVIGHASRGGDAETIAADLSQPGGADHVWDEALDRLDGRIDVLINNAGIFEAVAVDASPKEWAAGWARMLQINLQAPADLCRRAVLHFSERDTGGRIVNVASRSAYRGDSPDHWHYAAAKAGLVGMTKTIARAYAARHILVYGVAPGFTVTGAIEDYLASRGGNKLLADIPLGRVTDASEVANAVTYLALQAPAAMTGTIVDLNGASYVR